MLLSLLFLVPQTLSELPRRLEIHLIRFPLVNTPQQLQRPEWSKALQFHSPTMVNPLSSRYFFNSPCAFWKAEPLVLKMKAFLPL